MLFWPGGKDVIHIVGRSNKWDKLHVLTSDVLNQLIKYSAGICGNFDTTRVKNSASEKVKRKKSLSQGNLQFDFVLWASGREWSKHHVVRTTHSSDRWTPHTFASSHRVVNRHLERRETSFGIMDSANQSSSESLACIRHALLHWVQLVVRNRHLREKLLFKWFSFPENRTRISTFIRNTAERVSRVIAVPLNFAETTSLTVRTVSSCCASFIHMFSKC